MDVINIKDKNAGLEVKHQPRLFFYGSKTSPFLAPRAVFVCGEKLLVSDTAQNRIFIFNGLPKENFAEPALVIGQINVTNTQRNAGIETNAQTLLYPSGLWTDGKILVVADAWNHRVLIWTTFPTQNNQAADIVIGQNNMTSNQPNQQNVGSAASANSLYWPYGVCSDGKQLWIADTGNRRVLYFKTMPTTNGQAADKVIGQDNFNEKDYHHENAVWPYSVKVSANGQLAITDTQYFRTLIWHDTEDAFTQKAHLIIGQKEFADNGQNQYRLRPTNQTMSWCYDSCFYKNGIFIADTGNSRVLQFNTLPLHNNAEANDLYGNIHFEAIGEHLETGIFNHPRLYWPFSIHCQNNQLFVADTGNHRIALYELA